MGVTHRLGLGYFYSGSYIVPDILDLLEQPLVVLAEVWSVDVYRPATSAYGFALRRTVQLGSLVLCHSAEAIPDIVSGVDHVAW